MSDELEEEFDAIAQKAIDDAEAVKCEFSDFVKGLRSMAVRLRARADDAAAEARARR